MRAAALMGQLRSMLRSLLVDRLEPPSVLLRRLDHAIHVLGDPVLTTAILAYVENDSDGYRLHWSNAGHPAPILIDADGTVSPLIGRDVLLGAARRAPRTHRTRLLPPGSTVLLYTDGLIETRTEVIDDRKRQLQPALKHLADAPLPVLLDEVLGQFAGDDHEDDVALPALRTPGIDRQRTE